MIGERIVLLGVQDLQQGSAGIPPEIYANLVYLVQHEQGVDGLSTAHRLNDASW